MDDFLTFWPLQPLLQCICYQINFFFNSILRFLTLLSNSDLESHNRPNGQNDIDSDMFDSF